MIYSVLDIFNIHIFFEQKTRIVSKAKPQASLFTQKNTKKNERKKRRKKV